MIFNYPGRLLAIAIALMFFGVIMPFLMVIHLVESTLFLNFLSYAASTIGLFLGFITISAMQGKNKSAKKKTDKDGSGPFAN